MPKKHRAIIDDGFNSELVETAFFDGILEMPVIERQKKIVIPTGMVPFSKRNYSEDNNEHVVFYEHDINFADVLRNPNLYIDDIGKFSGVVTLDCSLYIDMPLIAQMANVYRSRAIGHYFQENGLQVIPNVRWGDERSYTTEVLPERFAFLGLPKGGIVSVGTYAGNHVASLKGNRYAKDGTIVWGVWKGVRVGVIRTHGKIATIFPDNLKQPNKRSKSK